jgi:hypothetical protein
MVLLAPSKRYPSVIVELQIRAVEEAIRPGQHATIALVLGELPTDAGEPALDKGMVLDILEQSPAA